MPSVPTILETAPSPGESHPRTATYAPRPDGELSRGASSLRSKTELSKRTHQSAASSRASSPGAGRFSARDEDLPDMEELESTKIPLPSFSGFKFEGLNSGTSNSIASNPPGKENSPLSTPSTIPATDLSSRLAPPPLQPAQQSLNVPQRVTSGPLTRFNPASTRPRASSPLAGNSITAESERPAAAARPSMAAQPESSGFIPLAVSTGDTTKAKSASSSAPSFLFAPPSGQVKGFEGLGKGKPSAAAATPQTSNDGSVPDFFGKKSEPTSGTATPSASTSFNFGVSKAGTTNDGSRQAPSTFSFGKPADTVNKPFVNGFSSESKDIDQSKNSALGFDFGPAKIASTAPSVSVRVLSAVKDAC